MADRSELAPASQSGGCPGGDDERRIRSAPGLLPQPGAGSVARAVARPYAWRIGRADRAQHRRSCQPGSPENRAGSERPQLRSEEHTSELQSLMRISYAVFCLKKKKTTRNTNQQNTQARSR